MADMTMRRCDVLKPVLVWKRSWKPMSAEVRRGFVAALVLVGIAVAVWILSAWVIPAVCR